MRSHMFKIDIDTDLVIFWSLLHPFSFQPAFHCHLLDPSAPISCTVNTAAAIVTLEDTTGKAKVFVHCNNQAIWIFGKQGSPSEYRLSLS